MAYNAVVLKDSVSPAGVRLTTMEVTIPRIVLAEFNTHRKFSRNSASSRAIPVEKMLKRVKEDPFIPIHWGKNQKGMSAQEEFAEHEREGLKQQWLRARDQAVFAAESLLQTGVHKQLTNRLLEPFLWQTIIVSSTEWSNFDALRAHPDAQPEIRRGAELMIAAREASTPQALALNEWHLPLTPELDDVIARHGVVDWAYWKDVSAGRCARVSYLTHDGRRDPQADIDLARRLLADGHMSPFEHVATPFGAKAFDANFRGWRQYRKTLPFETDRAEALAAKVAYDDVDG